MAASLLPHPSSLRSKPAFSLKTPLRASTLYVPSRVTSLEKKVNGFAAKCSMVATKSNSPPTLSDSRELKNPLIVIDNYDGFIYNLCQYMGELGCHFEVYRNDEITVADLKRKNPRGGAYIARTRHTTGFWNIVRDSSGAWSSCTFIWCVYGAAVYWRGFWGEDCTCSFWCQARENFSCIF